MPIKQGTPADDAMIATCINSFWSEQAARGRKLRTFIPWDAQVVASWREGGASFWVYAPSDTGRIDAICAYNVQSVQAPDAKVEELWMFVPLLLTRATEITDTAAREKGLFLAMRGAVPDAVKQGAVGITTVVDKQNVELLAFIDSWDATRPKDQPIIWEEMRENRRMWLRFVSPDLPVLEARAIAVGADTEPVVATEDEGR